MTGPYVVRLLETSTERIVGDSRSLETTRVVSVKAFETLEEAIDHGRRVARTVAGADLAGDLSASLELATLPAEGGRVSLPDGREIVVEQLGEQTGWIKLASQLDYSGDWIALSHTEQGRRDLLDAFNSVMAERYAAQEGRA